jgi:hypothetical protein
MEKRHIEQGTPGLVEIRELILAWLEYVAAIGNSDMDEASTTFAKEKGP